MSRRSYTGAASATTLAAPISSSDTTATLASAANLPTSNFVLTLDQRQASEEKILVGSRSGVNLSGITRGFDGTVGTSHTSGASVLHTISATDLDEANDHINKSTGVHGVTGGVVGTTDAQTLANKTLTAPVIGDFSNATHDHSSTSKGGLLPYPIIIPFHASGGFTTGLKIPRFIAPINMTLRTSYARVESGSGAVYRFYINGGAVADIPDSSAVGTTALLNNFTDHDISAGDVVQLYIVNAGTTAADLSATLYGTAR